MKKILVTLAAIAALSFSANAQYFVGGSIGLSSDGGKYTQDNTSVKKTSKFNFTIAPNVGYYFADNFLAGVRFGVALDKTTTPGLTETVKSEFNWAIQPYARYKFGEWNRFGLWGEVNAGIGRETGKTTTGSVSENDYPVFNWAINALPVLTFTINEHLCLETSLNFLNLGYEGSCTKSNDSDDNYKETDSSFSFGGDSSNVFGSAIGQIKIGFTYKF